MIKGKVLKILSQTKVLINLGNVQGVKEGMKFVIYDEGEMITDPTTKEPIEKLELVKGEVQIIQVQEKMSVGESFRIETRTTPPMWYSTIAALSETSTENVKVEEPLTTKKIQETIPSPLKEGDFVRSKE